MPLNALWFDMTINLFAIFGAGVRGNAMPPSGGQGLNLQQAKHVINTTPDWNPCLEAQAVARVWRRGQDKEVTYLRLIMKNTIEEYCVNTQDC